MSALLLSSLDGRHILGSNPHGIKTEDQGIDTAD